MTSIGANLQAVRARIERAARLAGRPPQEIQLIAVSKTWPVEYVAEAHACGQHAFGENQAQEGVEKILRLEQLLLEGHVNIGHHECDRTDADVPGPSSGVASPQGPLLRPPEWHFIGPIQSNKTRLISEHFQWAHSVERDRIAVRLNDARPEHMPPLNVCIQVNVSGEASKHGVEPGQELELARIIASLPRLRLRGLMAIPEPATDLSLQRRRFALLREARERLRAAGYALDTLSMGMSDDFEAAIREGATMVRVGTAIFGPRKAVNGK
jgi:PLP dependent protein